MKALLRLLGGGETKRPDPRQGPPAGTNRRAGSRTPAQKLPFTTHPSCRPPRWYRMQLASLQLALPQAFMLRFSVRTDPSPNRALTIPEWFEPKPNSMVLLAPIVPVYHQSSRCWVSATIGIQ